MVFTGLIAFSAGLVAAFNPCGVALLPSYLVYLLSGQTSGSRRHGWITGLRAGLLISIGFVILFGLAGIALNVFGHAVFFMAPIVSLALAIMLIALAWYMWAGYIPSLGLLGQATQNLEKIFQRGSPLSFLAYGISYGLASLSCSLPVFLAVMAQGITQGRFAWSNFAWFSLGMIVVVGTLSVLATTMNKLVESLIHEIMPAVRKLSAGILVLSSGYLVWYWVLGPGLQTLTG